MTAPMEPARLGEASDGQRPGTDPAVPVASIHSDLKVKTARGALSSVVGQGLNFVLRIGSMVVIARLVTPEQFGLVGMVTAVTGLLNLLRDGGLPQATVQRATLPAELTSTLFWLNFAIGVLLAGLTALAAPFLAAFYDDPRLFWITVVLGSAFVFNGASAQHRALLQRSMRFGIVVAIDTVALIVSIAVGIGMAVAELGYWALVGMAVALPATAMVGLWTASGWVPGRPKSGTDARAMLRYGGLITLNSVVVYVAYNVDKVLLGRFWGAEVLGLYGRAYQLISLPTENLQSAMGWVMFPALARVQDDPTRLRRFFLRGYGLFLSVVIPITMACGLLADDIVRVLLGPQWSAAVPVFVLLAPTILAFALLNPLSYLMQATGRVGRSLKLAFLIAPIVMLAYALGLPFGPTGVAAGFSLAMLILVGPAVHWAKQGTLITLGDLWRTALPSLVASIVAAVAVIAAKTLMGATDPLLRLVILTLVMFTVHGALLVFVMGQKEIYLDLLRTIRRSKEEGEVAKAETHQRS